LVKVKLIDYPNEAEDGTGETQSLKTIASIF